MVGTPSASKVSLLDLTPGKELVEWYVVYWPRTPHFFWANWLKQGFRHVELWRPYRFGKLPQNVVWLRLTPNFEILRADLEFDPTPPWQLPGVTVQKVQVLFKHWRVRQWFHFGPWSCTESVKAALGINKFWLRTPHQLYHYIKRHHGVLRHE